MYKILLIAAVVCFSVLTTTAQNQNIGSISGNFKLDAQSYQPNEIIGADSVSERLLSNSYMNVNYNYGNFSAGVRFEGYFNTMLGYEKPYDGFGLAYKFASYNGELVEVTAGNYYEQFGNGLVFRAYEDRDLGYDNAMEGMRIKLKPGSGIVLTGIIGKQRQYWELSKGIVRGVDTNVEINELISSMSESANRISFGASFVSKFQKDEDPIFKLPENTGAAAARLKYGRGGFSFNAEYALKSQDPSFDNKHIYKNGQSVLTNINYSQKGLGILLQYKWVDNMSFRSDRDQTLNNVLINYVPTISKNHSYAFMAMYPYATQPNGESGIQSEIFYKFKRNSKLGGKYGTLLSLNYTHVTSIKKMAINESTAVGKPGTDGYNSSLFSMGDVLYLQDFNLEISKKINKKIKGQISYQNLAYNQQVLEVHGDMVNANIFVADITWKIKPKHALRIESQAMFTKSINKQVNDSTTKIKQDYGDWAMLMLEYSFSPHWFFAISDQFNYVSFNNSLAENTLKLNHDKDFNRVHYYSVAMGYSKGSSRIQVAYGKQREGILCVGGVCRTVPAAYGFNISVTSTF